MVNLIKSVALYIILFFSPMVSAGELVRIEVKILCDSKEVIQEHLNNDWEEYLFLSGIFSNKKLLLHMFVNTENGSWSIVSLNTNKIYCILFAGDSVTLYRETGRQHAETY